MDAPTKVVGRRVVAFLVDAVVQLGLFIGAVRALGEEQASAPEVDSGLQATWSFGSTTYVAEGGAAAQVFLVVLGVGLLNHVLLQGGTGASLGKHLAGLRVVRGDGRVCGPVKALVRWLVLIVDAFPYVAPIVGFVMSLSTKGNRRLGDMAAGTFVVGRRHVGTNVEAAVMGGGWQGPPQGYGGPPPGGPPGPPPAPDARWDDAHRAWLRWDGGAWVRFDERSGDWRPVG